MKYVAKYAFHRRSVFFPSDFGIFMPVWRPLFAQFRSSVRSSRFGFGESEHVWWPHHVNSTRKRRETIVFVQLGHAGDVGDIGRGCGGL